MDKDLAKMDRIVASTETYEVFNKWVDSDKFEHAQFLPRPIESGLLMLGDKEYVLFDRMNDDVMRFLWFKEDAPYGSFEFDRSTGRLDNIKTVERLEQTDDVYVPFWRIINIHIAAMTFINFYVTNDEAVRVERKGPQHIYHLDHQHVTFSNMIDADPLKGQIMHFLKHGGSWNRH